MLGFVAVDARPEAAVLAGEDPPVFIPVEWLEGLCAAIHADRADLELLGVPGLPSLATFFSCSDLHDGLAWHLFCRMRAS